MRREWIAALGLALLYSIPWVMAPAGEGFLYSGQAEAVSLTSYGKWAVNPPYRFMTDGFTGDFATYYNYLGDVFTNLAARVSGQPAMVLQVTLFPILLGALFFLFNFWSLRIVFTDGRVPFVSALVLSLYWNMTTQAKYGALIHTPFHSLPISNAQSFGWLMVLPILCLMYVAFERNDLKRGLASGALLGLLFHTHTLTFLNVALVAVVFLTWREHQKKWVGKTVDRISFGAVVLVAGLIVAASIFGVLNLFWLAVASLLLLSANFARTSRKKVFIAVFGGAWVVMLPVLIHFAAHVRAGVADLQTGNAIPVLKVVSFYFPCLLMWGGLLRRSPTKLRPQMIWLGSIVWTTLFLGFNHWFGWGNHPYRFVTNLVFPLAIASGVGWVYLKDNWVSIARIWIVILLGANVIFFAGGRRLYHQVLRLGQGQSEVLKRLAESTKDSRGVVLNAPEFLYPVGVAQNATLMNVSSLPAFVPDYRYIGDQKRYRHRMSLFCFLFPNFPHIDFHSGYQACHQGQEIGVVKWLDPDLKQAVLPIYSIGYAASLNGPFTQEIRKMAQRWKWEILATSGQDAVLARVKVQDRPGLAQWESGVDSDPSFVAKFRISEGGRYHIILGGIDLEANAIEIQVDGVSLSRPRSGGDWMKGQVDLSPGEHELKVVWKQRLRERGQDSIFFVSAIQDRWKSKYFRE